MMLVHFTVCATLNTRKESSRHRLHQESIELGDGVVLQQSSRRAIGQIRSRLQLFAAALMPNGSLTELWAPDAIQSQREWLAAREQPAPWSFTELFAFKASERLNARHR
jgi:hypothetical protein